MKILNQDEMQQVLADAAKVRRQRILALYNTSGQSLTKIAAQMGISKQRVSALLKRARLD